MNETVSKSVLSHLIGRCLLVSASWFYFILNYSGIQFGGSFESKNKVYFALNWHPLSAFCPLAFCLAHIDGEPAVGQTPGPWWAKRTSLSPWAFQPRKSTGESYIPWGKVAALLYVKMNLPTGFIVWHDDTSLRGANLVAGLVWNKGVNYRTFAKCVLGTRPHRVRPSQCTWKRFQCLRLLEA